MACPSSSSAKLSVLFLDIIRANSKARLFPLFSSSSVARFFIRSSFKYLCRSLIALNTIFLSFLALFLFVFVFLPRIRYKFLVSFRCLSLSRLISLSSKKRIFPYTFRGAIGSVSSADALTILFICSYLSAAVASPVVSARYPATTFS